MARSRQLLGTAVLVLALVALVALGALEILAICGKFLWRALGHLARTAYRRKYPG